MACLNPVFTLLRIHLQMHISMGQMYTELFHIPQFMCFIKNSQSS